MDLNKVMIIGRLTRDPELRTIPSGANVCQIGIATGYAYTNQQTGQKVESTEFHNVVLWRKLGEIAAQYLKKGARVYIEGRLQTRSWDGQDGQKRYRTEIIAENMIMLGDNPNRGSSPNFSSPGFSPAPAKPAPSQNQTPPPPQEELPTIDQSMDEGVRVEDIPF
ncbi:MAG: single-stranded DNA-binding protein [Candidatus Doudnabacteria bacterium]|nr:single-stranded DNA-binding protein [Candidatus Doudnabacteria bacterium]